MKGKFKFRGRISAKLIIMFVLLITIPIAALGTGSYITSVSTMEEELKNTSYKLVEEIETSISNYLSGYENSVNMMSNDPNAQAIYDNPDSAQWMMASFKSYINSYKDVANVYLGTRDKEMFVYPSAQLPSGYDPVKTDWYKEAVKKGGLIWTDPYIDTATKKVVISAAMPVYNKNNGNEFIGVFGIDIPLEVLAAKIKELLPCHF